MTQQKPGWKTSEAWISLIVVVVCVLVTMGVVEADDVHKAIATVAGVLAAMGYSVGRVRLKHGPPPPPPPPPPPHIET